MGVQIEAGNITSSTMFARYIDDDDDVWVFNQLSLVLFVDEGKITELIWDKGCYACEDANCIEGNCAIPLTDCVATTNNCDFSVYLSWYGTDTDGRYLLSAGQRLSQFQKTSARSYYDYVKNTLGTDDIDFSVGE